MTAIMSLKRIQLPSTKESILEIEQLIDSFCETREVTQDCYGNMLIALTEAVNNAIQHGNGYKKEKLVEIEYEVLDDEILFTVKDEGNGFDFDKIPDPTLPENILKTSGRGVFLMQNLADKFAFENNGSIVKLAFCLSSN
ncbi:MAG TPA: ATP-binding protein [Vicingaceae bacterium]|jgi:serine/threonine-protein kinase RsbW|nr:ATP-binding protein [Vicingaceae bacterium]